MSESNCLNCRHRLLRAKEHPCNVCLRKGKYTLWKPIDIEILEYIVEGAELEE